MIGRYWMSPAAARITEIIFDKGVPYNQRQDCLQPAEYYADFMFLKTKNIDYPDGQNYSGWVQFPTPNFLREVEPEGRMQFELRNDGELIYWPQINCSLRAQEIIEEYTQKRECWYVWMQEEYDCLQVLKQNPYPFTPEELTKAREKFAEYEEFLKQNPGWKK